MEIDTFNKISCLVLSMCLTWLNFLKTMVGNHGGTKALKAVFIKSRQFCFDNHTSRVFEVVNSVPITHCIDIFILSIKCKVKIIIKL